jgi:hypothetical protein
MVVAQSRIAGNCSRLTFRNSRSHGLFVVPGGFLVIGNACHTPPAEGSVSVNAAPPWRCFGEQNSCCGLIVRGFDDSKISG